MCSPIFIRSSEENEIVLEEEDCGEMQFKMNNEGTPRSRKLPTLNVLVFTHGLRPIQFEFEAAIRNDADVNATLLLNSPLRIRCKWYTGDQTCGTASDRVTMKLDLWRCPMDLWLEMICNCQRLLDPGKPV
jgi:hypothetical protein